MITHIIYSSLSAGLLWLFYKLALEAETMHRFKRVYLLLIFPLSWLIPYLSFPEHPTFVFDIVSIERPASIDKGTTYLSQVISQEDWTSKLLTIIYFSVVLILLCRFIINLYSITRAGHNGSVVRINGQKLVVLNKETSPYSFNNTLFLGRTHYEKGIEPEVLAHEQAHMKQGHSWDIVIAELIIIANWFNPFAWLLKKSIQLNHEFLADQAVIRITNNIGDYQHLLLSSSVKSPAQLLSSQFNNPPLKKRIYMMFKHSPRWIIAAKQLLIVPILLVLVTLFSSKIKAQGKPFVSNNFYPAAKENAPQDIIEQYKTILDKYKLETREGQKTFFEKITPAEKKQLVDLYTKMSKEQQNKQLVGFMKQPKPLPVSRPTAAQFEKWKNSSVYGVWLDDKRIKNEELDKHTKDDFSYFAVSKLSKNATNYGKHYYQVTLMTNAHYDEYVKEQNARKDEPLMFIKWFEKEKK